MSGLLDKARKSAKNDVDSTVAEALPEEHSEAILSDDVQPFDNGLNVSKLKFQLGSGLGFLVTLILVFFVDNLVLFSGISLDDLLVPGVIIWWLLFNGDSLLIKDLDTTKLVTSGVAFLVVTVAFAGVAIFNSSDAGVTIANVEYDGDNDEIDLSFYGPKGMEYTVEVLVDGKVEYSHDDEINVDKGSHSVSLDDFWKGNAENMKGDTLVEYEIRVTSDGDESSMTFDTIMNREIDTAFIKITEMIWQEDGDKVYMGITVEMFVGIGNPGAKFDFSSDYFSGTTPMPIASDWTAVVAVKIDSATKYTYNEIDADEGVVSGLGTFTREWVVLPGTESGYLARDDFYSSGDDCYTFEVTIENEHGETLVDTSSKIEFYWDSNEATAESEDDQPAVAC